MFPSHDPVNNPAVVTLSTVVWTNVIDPKVKDIEIPVTSTAILGAGITWPTEEVTDWPDTTPVNPSPVTLDSVPIELCRASSPTKTVTLPSIWIEFIPCVIVNKSNPETCTVWSTIGATLPCDKVACCPAGKTEYVSPQALLPQPPRPNPIVTGKQK